MPRPSSRVPLFTQYTPQSAIEPIGASVRVRVMVCIPENNAVSYAPKQPSAIRTTCRGKFILEFRYGASAAENRAHTDSDMRYQRTRYGVG